MNSVFLMERTVDLGLTGKSWSIAYIGVICGSRG